MEIEELKRIVIDQKEEIDDLLKSEKIIERDINASELKRFLKYPNVLVISGVRRSGKSTLSLSIAKEESYCYINFDDERLVEFKSSDFDGLLRTFYALWGENIKYFLFDEIQNVKNWELFITRLRRTKRIIITGSNANLLSTELSTRLTGRHIDFTLYPFSFKEFLRIKEHSSDREDYYSTSKQARIEKLLKEYLEIGGFPDVYKFGKRAVEQIYDDIINKDILLRYKVRLQTTFKELTKYLISNFSSEISYSKLKNIFSIKNVHTVKDYIDYLSSSYLTFVLNKFSYKLKQQVIAPKKIYVIDAGIINFLAFQFSQNIGRLMENTVFLQLLRNKEHKNNRLETYFWSGHSGEEVDFVIKEGKSVKELVQVSFDINHPETKKRETSALLKAAVELRCDKLSIITWDHDKEEKIGHYKIKCVPLWKWLLD